MKLTTWLMAPVIAVLLCGPLVACPIRTRVVGNTVVTTPVFVAETVAVAVFQPVVITVPAVGAAYIPPAAPAPAPAAPAPAPTITPAKPTAPVAPTTPSADTQAILSALKAIDSRLRVLEAKGGLPVQAPIKAAEGKPEPKAEAKPAPSPATSTLTIFSSRCAACHEKAVAGEKGGGLVLLDGGRLATLTDRQARKVLSATYAGRMPPKPAPGLSDEEVATVATYVDSLK